MTVSLKESSRAVGEAELARRVIGGDGGAFETFMRRHNRMAFRTARAILRDDAEAEEAVQDAYMQAYRSLPGFRGDSSLSTWLARIVANEALMRLRKRTRRGEIVPLQPDCAEMEFEETASIDMHARPELSAERAEIKRLLEAQIDALPERYRIVFVLRAVEELTADETASVLQIPAATVRSRFFRARSLLREALALKLDLAAEDVFNFGGEKCDRIVANVLSRVEREKT